MSIYKNGKLIAGGRQCVPLLSFMWADHVLNDASWLRADTYSWQSGAVYQAAYQHLADDIDGKTLQSETIDGTTIQFYLADDGHKICPASEESNVSAIYNATGVAWYYIIDTANTRFKLPRTQFAFTGIRNGVGTFVEAGLPNITGTFYTPPYNSNAQAIYSDGSFSSSRSGATVRSIGYASQTYTSDETTFDASRSSSIYGNSTTVQPKATEMYLYFYVGNFTQTALENTAGLNAELFNGKADLDFGNTTMIDYVVEKQDPTAENNYTWYRKYKSGWVEQGGIEMASGAIVTLPIAMADTKYTVQTTPTWGTANSSGTRGMCSYLKTTTSFNAQQDNNSGSFDWQVSGLSAN